MIISSLNAVTLIIAVVKFKKFRFVVYFMLELLFNCGVGHDHLNYLLYKPQAYLWLIRPQNFQIYQKRL